MSRLSTTGWYLLVTLDGWRLPDSYLVENLTVDTTEDVSTLCEFTIRPPAGTIDADAYRGKTVTVDVQTSTDMHRIFAGVVDIPEVDLSLETLKLRCTNKLEELVNTQLVNAVKQIGYYSSNVFNTPKDAAEELRQRMETIPFSFYFDPYEQFIFTAWVPKATQDFTLTDSDIYYGTPEVELSSRGRILNRVNIKLQYRYNRDYHMQADYTWFSGMYSDHCLLLVDGATLTHRSLIQAAISSVGWPLRGFIGFEPVLAAGWYKCNGFQIAWSPLSLSGSAVYAKDSDGNVVNDANGNPTVKERNITGGIDYTQIYCSGCNFSLTTRWTQTLTEEYTATVRAPQSITQYGQIDTDQSFGYEDPYVSSGWEDYTIYTNLGFEDESYFIDRTSDRSTFNTTFTAATNKAKTSILKSHRDNFVRFTKGIWPEVGLHHTLYLNTTRVVAKGKVRTYRHFFNIATSEAYTDVEIAISKSTGSTTDSPLTVPDLPDTSVEFPNTSFTLENHYGQDPTDQNWSGMVGNKYVGGILTQYPVTFTVPTPAVPDTLRNSMTKTTSDNYDVEIPNDTLTIIFDGVLDG